MEVREGGNPHREYVMKRKPLTRGSTLLETIVTTIISVMVLGASLSMYVMGAANWARGENAIDVESNSRQGVRRVVNELRQAYYVSIDANGMGLTYRRPSLDNQGNFALPLTWDGLDRRIYYSNGSLLLNDGVNAPYVIARNIVTKDPFLSSGGQNNRIWNLESAKNDDNNNSSNSYAIFTPGQGSVTRSVVVKLVTRNPGGLRAVVFGRNRETIYLRNVPQVAK